MLKTKNQKLTVILILIIICSFLIYFYTKEEQPKTESLIQLENKISTTPLPNEKVAENIILEINNINYESKIANETNVYDFMKKLKSEEKIDFTEKNYPGMGRFIEEINGIKNKDKNWIYYVNGEKAKIGISNYKIYPGDVVSWKYENSY